MMLNSKWSRNSDATQAQFITNPVICKTLQQMIFGTLICINLHLICVPQIIANHNFPTFYKKNILKHM